MTNIMQMGLDAQGYEAEASQDYLEEDVEFADAKYWPDAEIPEVSDTIYEDSEMPNLEDI